MGTQTLTSSPLWPGSPGGPGSPGLPAQPGSPSWLSPWSGMDGECEQPRGTRGRRRGEDGGPLTRASSALGRSRSMKHCGRQPEAPSVERGSAGELAWHQGHPPAPRPSLLPGRSCQGLAHRGCPGLPSLRFPGGPPRGLSCPGYNLHRCSEEEKGRAVGSGPEKDQDGPDGGNPCSEPSLGCPATGPHPRS